MLYNHIDCKGIALVYELIQHVSEDYLQELLYNHIGHRDNEHLHV